MRPVITGRDFIYQNDIKVSYYRSGETRLELPEEELVAAIDIIPNPHLKLKIQITIPSHTIPYPSHPTC